MDERTKKMDERTKKSLTATAMLVWVGLQLYTNVDTIIGSMYYTFTGRTWIAMGAWFLSLLALDALLYFFGGRKLLRVLKWYWAFCVVPSALAVLHLLGLPLNSLIIIICALFAPLYQPIAFSWLLFEKIAGLESSVCFGVGRSAGLLFCFIQFAYMAWLCRRAKKRGETENGPVGPGAGTVE